MEESEILKKTVILEENEYFKRVRTQCDDQNYVRDYFMGQVSHGAAIAACSYLIDILMDISLMNLQILEQQGLTNLNSQQKYTFERLKFFHTLLSGTDMNRNTWEMDWVYVDVKHQQDVLSLLFFEKRAELQLGIPLPLPTPNPVPDLEV